MIDLSLGHILSYYAKGAKNVPNGQAQWLFVVCIIFHVSGRKVNTCNLHLVFNYDLKIINFK